MHNHSFTSKRNLIIVTFINVTITLSEIIGGLVSGSLALISDALHNFSDAVSVIISFIAIRIGEREHTEKHTFGYRRAEILAALLNAVFLIVVSIFLFKESIIRLRRGTDVDPLYMVVIGGVGFLANLISVLILKRDVTKNINIKSAYLHLLSDALTSLSVVAGGVFLLFTGLGFVDPLLTILICVYVIRGSFEVLKEVVDILMETAPDSIDLNMIKEEVEKIPEVSNIHHIHIWRIGDGQIAFEGHVDVDSNMDVLTSTSLIKRIENLLFEKFGINHVTIQVEYNVCKDKGIVNRRYGR